MPSAIKKLSAWMMVCAAGLMVWSGGCDQVASESAQAKADRQVEEELNKAALQPEKGRLPTLRKAAETSNASPLALVRARPVFAQAELAVAERQLNQLFNQRLRGDASARRSGDVGTLASKRGPTDSGLQTV